MGLGAAAWVLWTCTNGAPSWILDSGAYVRVCPDSDANHKMLNVRGMREVVFIAMDLQENVFAVKIPFGL